MGDDNVKNLGAFLEEWGRAPWTLEAWQESELIDMSFLDPDVIYEDTVLPDHIGEAYRGHEGVGRAAVRWLEGSEWLLVELEEIVEVGDRLVSVHRMRSRARHTGIEFDTNEGDGPALAYLWTFRNGKVIHFISFLGADKAVEAAGAAPQR